VNLIASLVFVFVLPFAAIATTYLYLDWLPAKSKFKPPTRHCPLPAVPDFTPLVGRINDYRTLPEGTLTSDPRQLRQTSARRTPFGAPWLGLGPQC
jgi:hypothetical protein